jgi:hypothetical protein
MNFFRKQNLLMYLKKKFKNLFLIFKDDFLTIFLIIFGLLVLWNSIVHASRTPDDFNFGGEWDFILTAKAYLDKGFRANHLISYWATYDEKTGFATLNKYTHYLITSFLPYIFLAKVTGAKYTAHFQYINLGYFFIFLYFLNSSIRYQVKLFTIHKKLDEKGGGAESRKKVSVIIGTCLLFMLFYDGYWRAILASFSVYTAVIVLAPCIAYYSIKENKEAIIFILGVLMFVMYEAFIPFFFVCVLFFFSTKKKYWLFLAFVIPFTIFGVRILINYWAYQDMSLVISDLLGAYGTRSSNCNLSIYLTFENLINYGNIKQCSLKYFFDSYLQQFTIFVTKLPLDFFISYKYSGVFFLYALIRIIFDLIKNYHLGLNKVSNQVTIGYFFGVIVFYLLLPAMGTQGWEFFVLMPIVLIGFLFFFKDLVFWVANFRFLNFNSSMISIFVIFMALYVGGFFNVKMTFPARVSEKERDIFLVSRMACQTANEITTNIDFKYFLYECNNKILKINIDNDNKKLKYVKIHRDDNSPIILNNLQLY